MRIGVFGGTFDPPHVGHLLLAADASEALRLDLLIFVPAGSQPFKVDTPPLAAGPDRLEMVRLAISGNAKYAVDDAEINREGLSYTVDTLSGFAAEMPSAELFWLVGADVVGSFGRWRDPQRITELATVVVLERTDEAPDLASIPGTPRRLATRRIDISSTEVRRRVREGRSIRGFVPDAVAEYIAVQRLYR